MSVETGVVVPAGVEVVREGDLVVLHVRASVKLAPGGVETPVTVRMNATAASELVDRIIDAMVDAERKGATKP